MAETNIVAVEPYRYFWLHTNIPKGLRDPNLLPPWGDKKKDGAWNDGDHQIGLLKEYCFGINSDIFVFVEPLIRVESDDGDYKWHKIDQKETPWAVMKFERCVALSQLGRQRARFKSDLNELIILSSDPVDAEIYDWLTGKFEQVAT